MRTKQLYVVLGLVVLGIVLAGPSVRAAESQLVVPAEVALGDPLTVLVTGAGENITTATLSVVAPRGPIAFEVFSLTPTTYVWSEVVTEAWGWGRGHVELILLDADGNATSRIEVFEVVCPPGCVAFVIHDSVQAAMLPVWVVSALLALVALAFVGHAAHVYSVDRSDLSWAERLILLGRLTFRRDTLRRDRLDKTGSMPEVMQKNWKDLEDAAQKLADFERHLKTARKEARFHEAEILLRSKRIKRFEATAKTAAKKTPVKTATLNAMRWKKAVRGRHMLHAAMVATALSLVPGFLDRLAYFGVTVPVASDVAESVGRAAGGLYGLVVYGPVFLALLLLSLVIARRRRSG